MEEAHEYRSSLEFTAIVLAGPGSGLYPLSERENGAKALNPIGNRPMIWYILQWLESEGINEIEMVTLARDESQISNYMLGVYEGNAKINITSFEEILGTAEIIRKISHNIKTDFIVVSADTILDIPAYQFLDIFRLKRPDVSMILAQEVPSEGGVRDDGDEERKYYGYDSETSRVVFIKELDEEDDKEENIFIRRKLIRKVSSIAISSNLVDMHVYVFRHWVKEFINDRPEIVSLQSDLIPMLVRAQMNRKTFDRLELSKYIPDNSPNDNISNKKELTVFGYIRRGGIGGRSDTIGRYLNLNRIVCKVSTDARQGNRGDAGYSRMVESVRPIIDNKAMVGSDSLIGKSSKLAEKCVVKRSAIGSHCVIGRNVKITNSVIQDHVTIEDNAKLENTVVCKNAVVKSKSSLKDCEVGAFAIVPANTNAKGEQILKTGSEDGTEGVQIKFS